MIKNTAKADREWILWVCKGDQHAADFLHQFFAVCHSWDDLIDKDKPVPDTEINAIFWISLIDIPNNLYYQKHFLRIHPVMSVAIQEWFAANKLESGDRKDIAYTLRCSIVSLIHQAAEICGGYEWALEIGDAIRLKTQDETLDEYIEDLKCHHSQRAD